MAAAGGASASVALTPEEKGGRQDNEIVEVITGKFFLKGCFPEITSNILAHIDVCFVVAIGGNEARPQYLQ